MFQVSVEETFSSGHALRGYQGKCENPHGHNYRVQITLEGTWRFSGGTGGLTGLSGAGTFKGRMTSPTGVET